MGKRLLGPNGRSYGGKDGRGSSMAGRGSGWLAKRSIMSNDGLGGEEQVQTNMALMTFLDSEVYTDKTCSKTCLKNYETLKKQCDDLIVKLNQTEFTASTYKRVPPPHPLIYNRPNKLDLSYSGLNEFKVPEFKRYGSENSEQESNVFCDKKSDDSKENSDNSLVKEKVSKDTSSFVESSLKC
ncbi:hypothetical protein Tco_0667398 [Tanacetum coccineum]